MLEQGTMAKFRTVRMVKTIIVLMVLAVPGMLAAQDDPPEKPLVNRLKWATASEVNNFGFDVYRGETEEGPFTRLNESPIEGAGNSDEPSFYEYVDDTIDPRKAYYYYVESISLDGRRERFTPIYPAPAKLAADAGKDAPSDPNQRNP